MKTIKTSDLTGAALDWAVAKCENYTATIKPAEVVYTHPDGTWHHNGNWKPSTNWAQGGPIIDREKINLAKGRHTEWEARELNDRGIVWFYHTGPTPLIAAMRCYVASKLGDTVEVPEELL